MSVLDMHEDSRRETIAAAAVSVLIHCLIILGAGLAMIIPAWQFPLSPEAEPEPIELTILPAEAPKPSDPAYVRTSPQDVKDAPKNAPFESDNNTRAASEAAASGNQAMPSVDGAESPALDLQNQKYTQGRESQPAQPSAASPQEQAQPETAAPPEQTAPAPPTQLALREAPKETPLKPRPKPPAEAAQAKPASPAGFQPETRVTRIRGNISNRGRASVDAAATPIGRYKKMVSDAIGSRWYYYVNSQIGLLNIGTVDIRFQVEPDGKVRGVRVISNTSNESFASVSISSIVEAEIPPIPEEVAKLLDNGRLEIDYSFTILSN